MRFGATPGCRQLGRAVGYPSVFHAALASGFGGPRVPVIAELGSGSLNVTCFGMSTRSQHRPN
jgi:hypothetical protein